MQNRLIMVQQGAGVGQPDRAKVRSAPFGLAREIGVPTDEGRRFVRLADKVEAQLVRRFCVGHLMAPVDEALFDPERIQRLAADQFQAKFLACLV